MIKIFNRDRKVNFVDSNNVLVGFDMEECCCEHFGWFISDEKHDEIIEETENLLNLDEWVFDPDFMEKVEGSYFDEGGMVRFRFVNGEKEKFLHLFNFQNGYYGHGFTVEIGGIEIVDGCI